MKTLLLAPSRAVSAIILFCFSSAGVFAQVGHKVVEGGYRDSSGNIRWGESRPVPPPAGNSGNPQSPPGPRAEDQCRTCDGAGQISETTTSRCTTCGGQGSRTDVLRGAGGSVRYQTVTCPSCGGSGNFSQTTSATCPTCKGSGQKAATSKAREAGRVPVQRAPDEAIEREKAVERERAAAALAAREKFARDKKDALSSLKGISDTDSLGLKGIGSPGLQLKGIDDSPAFKQLKGVDDNLKESRTKPREGLGLKDIEPRSIVPESSQPPSLFVGPSAVDARHAPSGLPKAVEDSIPQTPAGGRVRKGLQAVMLRDWKVALAWFQDALNQEPNNPDLQKLVDFAQTALNESQNPAPVLSKEMLHELASRDLERARQASERDVMMTRKLAEWKSKPGEPMSEDLMIWLLARPRPSAAADGSHWLQGVKEDPRYKEIQSRWQDTKDIALMFRNEPGPSAVKQYEREIQDFYAAWATKQGHAQHYVELRKSSEALAKACDQIEADKKARFAAESARWEKDWTKALANPNNRSGLKFDDPDVIGPEARHAITEHLLQVQAIEEATQKRLLDAGHQILTLGNTRWTPSQSSTQK